MLIDRKLTRKCSHVQGRVMLSCSNQEPNFQSASMYYKYMYTCIPHYRKSSWRADRETLIVLSQAFSFPRLYYFLASRPLRLMRTHINPPPPLPLCFAGRKRENTRLQQPSCAGSWSCSLLKTNLPKSAIQCKDWIRLGFGAVGKKTTKGKLSNGWNPGGNGARLSMFQLTE